jgi:hypothetical protein
MPGSNAKYRKFTQLVNAENPFYLYNYAEGSRDLDMVAPAICGKPDAVTQLGLGRRAVPQWPVCHAECGTPQPAQHGRHPQTCLC